MDSVPRLVLKPLMRHDGDSQRIYENTGAALERLNIYLTDFIDSVTILKEELVHSLDADESAKAAETSGKIAFMEGKITSICDDMRRIAAEMPEYVEILEVRRDGD